MKDWFYDESTHVGVDYSQDDNADVYDQQMDFRDFDAEVLAFIQKTGLTNPETMVAVDLGCGTGAFSIHAANRFKKVHAVDVSEAMQRVAQAKAEADGITNIEFTQAGFLQFDPGEQVDVVNTKWALHHIPDYWKQAALLNVNRMLKSGGVFFLADFIFQFDPDFERNTQAMLDRLAVDFDADFIDECKTHIREEYSTFDWILRGMLERAGFDIESFDMEDDLASEIVCRKVRDV